MYLFTYVGVKVSKGLRMEEEKQELLVGTGREIKVFTVTFPLCKKDKDIVEPVEETRKLKRVDEIVLPT